MASRRVWLAIFLLLALLPPSQLAPAATAADAAKGDGAKTEAEGAKSDGATAGASKDTGEVPKTTPGGGDKGGTAGGAAGGGPVPDKATETPVVPENPPTVKLPDSPETSSFKQTTTSSTSTTTTTLRPPPNPKPKEEKCPEPDWAVRNDTEIEAYVRCRKEKEKHVLKCAFDPPADADKEWEAKVKAMQHGRDLPVCFLTSEGKRGKKWIYREELAKLADVPFVCKTEECMGEILLGSFEYRCFWDNCNEKIEVSEVSDTCKDKLKKEGIEAQRIQDAPLNNTKDVVTQPPLPKPRGMDEYNEMYERLKADHPEDFDFDDDDGSGNHTGGAHPHEAKKESTSLSAANQFAIVGLLALLWILNSMQLIEKERSRDPCSAANIDHATITHMAIKWDVHFLLQMLDGSVSLSVKLLKESTHVILDARDLYVRSVTVDGLDAEFSIAPWQTFKASKLSVALPEEKQAAGTEIVLHIIYSTSAAASALQWLKKEQTTDGKAPYLFSQCQPIHARSIVPCMDTPSVKLTYEAEVTVDSGLQCLMSAICGGSKEIDGRTRFFFNQPVAIPSYLLAIVVGALERREISSRCAIWAEASIVEKAQWEFEETEAILSCAESICGPYVWGRYDMVCLPATFPYGGMENPCLTFVTPTLIAGDRSLVSVVAHEIAHSWSGNLVTNSTWEHFWLNEGFTVCIERKICGRLVNESYRQFMALNGWRGDLVPTINEHFNCTHPLTKLVQTHEDIDPELTFSSIAYEKGSAFLLALEQALGAELFEKYLRAYIAEFSHKSIDSYTWREHLYEFFADRKNVLDSVNIDAWLFEAGMPPTKPEYDDTMVSECDRLVKEWIEADEKAVKAITPDAYLSMKPLQRVECFSQLWQHDPPLPHYKLEALDSLYSLDKCGNFEIQFQWILLCIKCRWEPIVPRAIQFLNSQGRLKYCRPVYRALTGWPKFADDARNNFLRTRQTMHPITAEIVSEEINSKHATLAA